MKCKLCLEEKELIKKSHILSDFLFLNVREEDNMMLLMNVDSKSKQDANPKKVYTPEFEGGILCANCDNHILGANESYAAYVLYGKGSDTREPLVQKQKHPDGKLLSLYAENVDYVRFKLFLLGLIWRASISTRPFFKQVTLGPYEEVIRKMLLEGRSGQRDEFPCVISYFHDKDSLPAKVAMAPYKFRKRGIGYVIHLGQLIFMYFISPGSIDADFLEATISPEGALRILENVGDLPKIITKNELGIDLP
jgi:hypothetical protein